LLLLFFMAAVMALVVGETTKDEIIIFVVVKKIFFKNFLPLIQFRFQPGWNYGFFCTRVQQCTTRYTRVIWRVIKRTDYRHVYPARKITPIRITLILRVNYLITG